MAPVVVASSTVTTVRSPPKTPKKSGNTSYNSDPEYVPEGGKSKTSPNKQSKTLSSPTKQTPSKSASQTSTTSDADDDVPSSIPSSISSSAMMPTPPTTQSSSAPSQVGTHLHALAS